MSNACWLCTITWQPANRFWLFQGFETAIFLGLVAVPVWWVRRRPT